MTIVSPSAITALPPAPIKGQAGFSAAADAFVGALPPFGEQVNAAGAATYSNALDAKSSAEIAIAAAATANAKKWVDDKNYVFGEVVISPAALLNNAVNVVYICKVDTGGVHLDPYSDPTHWAIFTVSSGVGGAVYTTSTTLTSSSPFAISISGGSGVWIKLPDATTMSKGIAYTVRNTGDNDVTLIDAVGAHIGFIRPQCGTTIALSDNSTAAGKWVGDWEQIGITADFQILSTTAGATNIKQIIQLDVDRTMIVTGGDAGQELYAVVHDRATGAAGTPVFVRAGVYAAAAAKTAENQVLVVSFDGSNPGNLAAIVLTTAGAAITVGTAVTASIAGSIAAVGQIVLCGGAWCIAYSNASYGYVRAITISGATPSVGAALGAASSGVPRLYVSGSILRAVRVSSASTIVCTPYTVSGNALTAGTLASTATTLSDAAVRTLQYSNGDIIALHTNGGNYVASIFRLSTLTEAVNSANIRSHGTINPSSLGLISYDYSVISPTKIAVAFPVNSDSTTVSINCIVDNSGTPTAGTAIDFAFVSSGLFYATEIKTSNANEAGFIFSNNAGSLVELMFFDCAGASPIRSRVQVLTSKIPSESVTGSNKNQIGVQHGSTCFNSNYLYKTGAYNNNSNITPIYALGANGAQNPCKITPILRSNTTIRGENDQTAWAVTSLKSAAEGSLGVALQRVQVASK